MTIFIGGLEKTTKELTREVHNLASVGRSLQTDLQEIVDLVRGFRELIKPDDMEDVFTLAKEARKTLTNEEITEILTIFKNLVKNDLQEMITLIKHLLRDDVKDLIGVLKLIAKSQK